MRKDRPTKPPRYRGRSTPGKPVRQKATGEDKQWLRWAWKNDVRMVYDDMPHKRGRRKEV